jgi:hypothetical protein
VAAISFIESVEYRLKGNVVCCTLFSDDEEHKVAVPIAEFIRCNLKGRAVIAEWSQHQASIATLRTN